MDRQPRVEGRYESYDARQFTKGTKKEKRPPPTEEQVQLVKDHYLDPDALPAVVFLCTGERRGEACGMPHLRSHVRA